MSYIPPPPPNDPYGQVPPPPPTYQPSYGAQPYGSYDPSHAAYSALEGRSTTVLVLGILGLVLCGLLAPVAWVMGNGVRKEALAMSRPEPGNNKAGRICGIIGTCLIGIGVVFLFLAIIGAFATSGSGSS